MNKLTYTKEDSMLSQAELTEIRHFTLDELEMQDEHYFDHFKPELYCHYKAAHKLAVDSVFGVGNTTHVDVWVYSLIVGFTAGANGACYLSTQEIADLFGYGDSAVRRSVKKLLGAKLIKQLGYRTGSPIKTLAAPLNHPALLDAEAWSRGEIKSRSRAIVADDPRRMQALQIADVLRELALNADESWLSLLFTANGGVNFPELQRLLGEGKALAEQLNGAAAARAAEEDAELLAESVAAPDHNVAPQERQTEPDRLYSALDPIDNKWPYESDYNALAELAAEHTTRSIDNPATKAAYEALRADFSASEILGAYKALEAAKKGTPGEKWPSLHSFLVGERSCRGPHSARRLASGLRERKALEDAAAAAAEADRAAQERDARRAADYEAVLRQLVEQSAEYAALDAEMLALLSQIRLGATPGDPAYEAKQRFDEIASRHDAILDELKAEARRRCGLE